jgi:hypothetical protein
MAPLQAIVLASRLWSWIMIGATPLTDRPTLFFGVAAGSRGLIRGSEALSQGWWLHCPVAAIGGGCHSPLW